MATSPLISAPVATINNAGTAIAGSATAGNTVIARLADGTILGTALVNGISRFSMNFKQAQINGEKIYLTQVDASGNESAPSIISAPDFTAPTEPENVKFVADGSGMTGKTEAFGRVTVVNGYGAKLGETYADKDGNFTLALSEPLKNGEKVSIYVTDAASLSSKPLQLTAPDFTPPKAPESVQIDPSGTLVTGKAEPGATISVKDPSGKEIGTGTVLPDGTFVVTVNPAQTNGENLKVTATDPAGNTSPSTGVVAPDTTAPLAPENVAVDPKGEVVTGKAEPGATVSVKDSSGKEIGTGTALPDGTFSVTLTTPQKNGETVTVTATDNAGNTSPGTAAVAPDLTAPNAPTDLNIDPKGEVVTGKAEPNSTVTIKDPAGNVIGTGTTKPDGTFSVTLTTPQKNGETVTVTAADKAGNTSPEANVTALDTTAPKTPTDAVVDQVTGATVTGKAEPNSTVTVKDPAGNVIGTGTTKPDGTFSVALTTPQKNGETVSVTAADKAGNTSPNATAVAPDLTAPNAPTDLKIDPAGVVLTGKAEPNSSIAVKDAAGNVIGTGTTKPDGTFSVALTTPQKNGETVSVTAADKAGNTSPAANVTAADTTAPNTPTDAMVDQVTGATVTGKAEPNSTITVKDPAGNVIGTGTTKPDGTFSVALTTPQKNGETVSVTATDAAGNPSVPATAVAPDHVAPDAPTDVKVDDATGATVTGKAEPNSNIVVKDQAGNVIGTGVTGTDGKFAVAIVPAQKNGETVSVTASDISGNTSQPSTGVAPDLTAPNAPTDVKVENQGLNVTGKAEPNSNVVVKDAAGKIIGTGVTDPNGNFVVALTVPQKNGETVSVTAADKAGNTSPATNAVAPDITAPDVKNLAIDKAGLVLTGESEPNTKIDIKDASGKVIAQTTTDATGKFTVTFTKPYGSGELLGVVATDAAGNASAAQYVKAPTLLVANSEVVQADVDLAYITSTKTTTSSVGFGSLGKILGIPIFGSNSAEINFSVKANETSTVDIKAFNTSLGSLLDGIKFTLYKQNASGVWEKVVDSKNSGLFDVFFFFFPEGTHIQTKPLDAGNYKVIAEDTTLFGIFSGNNLTVTQTTTTTSGDLEAVKANAVSGNVMANDLTLAGTTVTKLFTDNGTSVNVPATGKVTLVGTYGKMVIAADGSYTYTPNKSVKVVGQVDTFNYSITDKNGNISTAKVYVQIGSDEVNVKWDPANPGKPGSMLDLHNDTDFVIGNVAQTTDYANVDSGILSAQSSRTASLNSNTFTVGKYDETTINVNFKAADYVYSDAAKTTFTWQLQKYNAQTGQWVNVAGANGSKTYGYFSTVKTGESALDGTATISGEGQYRVNFQTSGGSYFAQKFDTNVMTTTVSHDKWYLDEWGSASGNIFTGEGVDTAAKDTVGFGKKLSISTDGGLTFKAVGSTELVVQGKYGTLAIKADGSYNYQQDKDAIGREDFVYKVVTGSGESQTAHLNIEYQHNVQGSSAADFYTSSDIYNVLEMGTGADTVKFTALNQIGHGDYWADFSKAEGDKIDVSSLLSNKGVNASNIGSFVSVEKQGTDTVVKIDLDGKGTQHVAKELVVLQNTDTTLDDLLKGNHIIY